MPQRALSPTAGASVVVLPLARPAPQAARLIPLAPDLSVVLFDAADSGAAGPLVVFVDGERLDRPVIGTRLALRTGGWRHAALLGRGAGGLLGRRLTLVRAGVPVAAIDPAWLQSPLAEPDALIEDLDDDGAFRLLRLVLTTGGSLFGATAGAELDALARRLLDGLGIRPLPPASVCATGAMARIASFRLADPLDATAVGDLVALTGGRPMPLADAAFAVEASERGAILHLHLARPLPEASLVVGTGRARLALRLDAVQAQPLAPWLARRSAGTRAWTHRLVETLAERDPVAAAIEAELASAAIAPPALGIGHLSGTPDGVLYALSLADPRGLATEIRIERGGRSMALTAGPEISGYARLPRQSRIDDRARIVVVYRSGRLSVAAETPLAPYRGEPVPAALPRPVAEARLDLAPSAAGAIVETFGPELAEPLLSIVVPAPADLDLVRARAALVFSEPERAAAEIVCHAEPEIDAVRAALAHAAAAWGVRHRLVRLMGPASASARLTAALAAAAGKALLVLDADVLPAGPGWLAPWLRRADTAAMAFGSVADHDGAALAAPSACVGLSRAAADRLATLPYPTPAVPLLVLAARLRAEGLRVAADPRARFVRYGPAPASAAERAVDAAALDLLKTSFSLGCEGPRP